MPARRVSGIPTKEIIMNMTPDGYTVNDGVADTAAQQREDRAAFRFTAWLAVIVAILLGLSVWIFVTTGVPDVSAAAGGPQPTPQVPYFPSQYVNQATDYEPPPPTF
jgi:hypothetical protein